MLVLLLQTTRRNQNILTIGNNIKISSKGELGIDFLGDSLIPNLINCSIGSMVLNKIHIVLAIPVGIEVIHELRIISPIDIGSNILIHGSSNQTNRIERRPIGRIAKHIPIGMITAVGEPPPHVQDLGLVGEVGEDGCEHVVLAVAEGPTIEDVGGDGVGRFFVDAAVVDSLDDQVHFLLRVLECVQVVLFPASAARAGVVAPGRACEHMVY